jgi:hypothetical protein
VSRLKDKSPEGMSTAADDQAVREKLSRVSFVSISAPISVIFLQIAEMNRLSRDLRYSDHESQCDCGQAVYENATGTRICISLTPAWPVPFAKSLYSILLEKERSLMLS